MAAEQPLFQLDASMRGAMATALIAWLEQEGRLHTVVAQSFAYLMEPAEEPYGRKSQFSRVETAFRSAAQQQLETVAHKMLNEDGAFQEKLRTVLAEQVTALMSNDVDFRNRVAEGLTAAIKDRH